MGSFLAINCEDLAFGQIEPFSHKWRNFFEKTSLLTVSKAISKSAFRLFTTLYERSVGDLDSGMEKQSYMV